MFHDKKMSEIVVVLAEHLEEQPDCNRYKKKNNQQMKKSFMEESVLFNFPFQTYGNHATDL